MKLLPQSLTNRRSSEHKSHKFRWFVLIAAAAFAVAWRTQTAISRAPQRLKAAFGGPDVAGNGGTATRERPTEQRREQPASQTAATHGQAATETPGTETPSQAAENPASAAEGDISAWRASIVAEPADSDTQAAGTTEQAGVTAAPETEPAGVDANETFRPAKAEPDDFGVVVTDDEPSGLAGGANWVQGLADGSCPDDHPIKGNASSRIYHPPGSSSYNQTHAELCFASEEDATAAGYRPRAHR